MAPGSANSIMSGADTPRTNAQRQQSLRDARRSQGLKEVRNLWCHPADEQSIREYAETLARRREVADNTAVVNLTRST